jgi:hypothetical protein
LLAAASIVGFAIGPSVNLDAFYVCAQLGHFAKASEKLEKAVLCLR